MMFSLIISTRGRLEELRPLFRSLREQTCRDFEVIVADQNEDDRLAEFLAQAKAELHLTTFKSSGGLSRGRNQALALAKGDILGFPDDDCAYGPRFLEEVARFFAGHPEYGFLSGRSYADDGGDSVSRHARSASEISRDRIHSQFIEFAFFVRRSALGETRFDEEMGVGTPAPWQSDEGPDLVLRLQGRGIRGFYDPAFGVWHPRPVTNADARAIDRTYRYACGNGYFLGKHRYSWGYFAGQMARTTCGVLLFLVRFNPSQARLYLVRLRGRWRGWQAGRRVGRGAVADGEGGR